MSEALHHSLPAALLTGLEGVPGYDRVAFEKVHADGGQVTSVRMNPWKPVGGGVPVGGVGEDADEVHAAAAGMGADAGKAAGALHFTDVGKIGRVPWSSHGYYLERRPSFTMDPLFHAGGYYVQEASSMFLEQALRQTVLADGGGRPLRVLDCCAAPGGKSTLIESLLPAGSLLVSNEVIRTRVNILQENMVKWGAGATVITSSDPRDIGRLENYFDVIVVDAPCSGSGLFRREPEAVGEWSPGAVDMCAQRQQRILADCWPALREGGVLIYSTCSFSTEEDEAILDWMMEELDAEGCRLSPEEEWQIVETMGTRGGYGYRFWPDRLRGEGFFIAAVRKNGGGGFTYPKGRKTGVERLSKAEEQLARPWVEGDLTLFRHNDFIHAMPGSLMEDLSYLQSALYLKKAGVTMGKLAGRDLIPEHDLALSRIISQGLSVVDLTREDAIRYLRKDEIHPEAAARGWALVRYGGLNLGWVKVLPNRVNNYYPKEWRILKRDP